MFLIEYFIFELISIIIFIVLVFIMIRKKGDL